MKNLNNNLSEAKAVKSASAFLFMVVLSQQTPAINNALKIRIAGGAYSDETVIRFEPGATDGFDGSYDAWKLFSGNLSVPNIFTKDVDGNELSINAWPDFTASVTKDVLLRIGVASTYTFTPEETGSFAPGVCIKMKDLVTGLIYDMRAAASFTVSLPVIAKTDPARFRVFFSFLGAVQTTAASCSGCADGSAAITKTGESNWLYSVVNASGSNVASGASVGASVTVSGLAVGSYTATISSDYTCDETVPFVINGPVTYYSRMSGNWNDGATWSTAGCGGTAASAVPGLTNNVVICAGNNVTVNAPASVIDLTVNGTLLASNSMNLTGNWTNNGTFNAGTQTVTFNGTRTQTISGTSVTSFYNFTANNSYPAEAIRLSAPVNVYGTLTLRDGHITTTSSNILTCGTSSSISFMCTPQDSSFVKGPMNHVVNVNSGVTKIFPVGKANSYRRIDLLIDQKLSTATTYTAEMIDSSAQALGYTMPPTIENVSYVRYHRITQNPSTTKVDVAQVRIYFGCTGQDDNVQALPPISVAKDNGSAAWVDLTDTPSGFLCGSTYWGSALSGTFTSFVGNKFSLTNTGEPTTLPVLLTGFDARPDRGVVNVSWTTASESNSEYFSIERSADGFTFEPIGNVRAAGYSASAIEYLFADEAPLYGYSFYRIKMADADGKFTYSTVVSVLMQFNHTLLAFPVPAKDKIFVLLNENPGEVQLIIRDMLGKEVMAEKAFLVSGSERISLDLSGKLLPGIYTLQLIGSEKVSEQKIVIN